MKRFKALYVTLAGAALALVCIEVNAGIIDTGCSEPDSQGGISILMADNAVAVHDDTELPAIGGEGDGAIGGNAPNPEPDRSVTTVLDDTTITADVKIRLLADTTVSGLKIDVDTRSGVVYLTGDNMQSQAAIDQALKLAKSTDGVKRVVSKMAIGDVKKSP